MHRGVAYSVARRLYWLGLNRLSDRRKRAVLFFVNHRGRPHLDDPRTFNEKVNWRVLNDRREILAIMGDKLAMKDYVAERAPQVRVPRTYWSGTDLAELAAVDLPERWVLKPNHSTERVLFGSGRPDVEWLRTATRGWLEHSVAARTCEWAYTRARPLLFVEEFVGGEGRVPADYKLHVFDGVTRVVQVDHDRFGDHKRRYYDGDFAPFTPVTDDPSLSPVEPPPAGFESMKEIARALAGDLDFLRVDLYEADGAVWFGELTAYPGAGLDRWDPYDLDAEVGEYWRLPALA